MDKEILGPEALRNFYARQAHLIDTAQHEAWAGTFTRDGEFHSPTYGTPAVGFDQLADISRRYADGAAKSGTQQRHLVQNIWIERYDDQAAVVHAYLSVSASNNDGVRILRTVTLEDQFTRLSGQWLIRKRQVVY